MLGWFHNSTGELEANSYVVWLIIALSRQLFDDLERLQLDKNLKIHKLRVDQCTRIDWACVKFLLGIVGLIAHVFLWELVTSVAHMKIIIQRLLFLSAAVGDKWQKFDRTNI